jgi:DNA-binding CsgD family transcriptional regulator
LPLHEAPHSDDAWIVSLSGLARLIHCDQVAMVEREGTRVADTISFGTGSDERFNKEYRNHYVRLDPFATEAVQARLIRSRRVFALDELVDREALEASEFYRDYWHRYGIHDGLAAGVAVTGRHNANFCALHGPGRTLDREDRTLFDLFVRHARAALRQRYGMRVRDAALRGLLDSTDCLADAVFVIDGNGALVQTNAAADALIERGDVVRLRGGELRLGRNNGPDPLADLLVQLTAPRRGDGGDPVRCLAIRESDNAGDELLVTAVRMVNEPSRGAPAGILFLRRGSETRPNFRAQHLRDLFGFTPAETRIANALLAGERVEDVATRLDVRPDTVRGHIKRMLAKTGTRRQSDLVCRLASAVPNLRAFAPAA